MGGKRRFPTKPVLHSPLLLLWLLLTASDPRSIKQDIILIFWVGILFQRQSLISKTPSSEIQQNLTRRNWVHFPEVIKPVHVAIVREFYANAYLQAGEKRDFTSLVKGKFVRYDWRTIDKLLQINYQGHEVCNLSSRRTKMKEMDVVDYDELLNFLCRPGLAWVVDKIANALRRRIRTKDLKPIAKAWCTFLHQTIEPRTYYTDLTLGMVVGMVAIGIVAIMKDEEVNISRLISEDISIIAQHDKFFLGHASLIVRLFEEAGAEDLSGGALLNTREPINFHYINGFVLQEEANQRRAEEQAQQPQPPPQQPHIQEEEQAQQPQPPPQQPHAQPFQPHDFGDETTIEHRFQMASFCWMQDLSVRLGIPATYLAHQTDMWAAAQRFRERYSGPPPTP